MSAVLALVAYLAVAAVTGLVFGREPNWAVLAYVFAAAAWFEASWGRRDARDRERRREREWRP